MPQRKKGRLKGYQRLSGSVRRIPSRDLFIDTRMEYKDYRGILQRIKRDFKNEPSVAIPSELQPMMAIEIKEAFNDRDWQFEIYRNGLRTISYSENGNIKLISKECINEQYPAVVQALLIWPVNAIMDGEIVVHGYKSKAGESSIKEVKQVPAQQPLYYVSDLLWLEGIDLMHQPLSIRKELLKKILPDKGIIRYNDAIEECGVDLFYSVMPNEPGGIMAKRKDSLYFPGQYTENWLKIEAFMSPDKLGKQSIHGTT